MSTTQNMIQAVIEGHQPDDVIDDTLHRNSVVEKRSPGQHYTTLQHLPKDLQVALQSKTKKPLSFDELVLIDTRDKAIYAPEKGGVFRGMPSVKTDTKKLLSTLNTSQRW